MQKFASRLKAGEMPRYLGLGKESSFAQAATISRYVDPITFSLTPEKEPIIQRTVASRSPVMFYSGKLVVTGEVEVPLYPDVLGDFLLMLLGKVSTSQPDPTNAPSVYQHEFTPIEKDETPPTYTLEAGMDSIARKILNLTKRIERYLLSRRLARSMRKESHKENRKCF